MIATIEYNSRKYKIDLSKPLDISIAIDTSKENINAWYLDDPKIFPVSDGNWIGSVQQGADVNFNNIQFNPHSHITHTECVGHITEEVYSVNKELSKFFFLAEVVTIAPEQLKNKDFVISKNNYKMFLGNKKRDAIVIRTLPNLSDKKIDAVFKHKSNLFVRRMCYILKKKKGIEHLLIDLPSVDKEKDEGKLLAHNAFWDTQGEIRMQATITEFIYVPNRIEDGTYFLNLMIAPFENDATPSKPILYKLC